MRKLILMGCCVSLLLCACGNDRTIHLEQKPNQNSNNRIMNSYLSMLEIPASDISRAIGFYASILQIDIELMELPEMKMGIFPYDGQMVPVVIVQQPGFKAGSNGPRVYLNAGKNLQAILDRVAQHGGTILMPRTAHADDSGYFALFVDSEGNQMGLHESN